jgi:hypothetical protein
VRQLGNVDHKHSGSADHQRSGNVSAADGATRGHPGNTDPRADDTDDLLKRCPRTTSVDESAC